MSEPLWMRMYRMRKRFTDEQAMEALRQPDNKGMCDVIRSLGLQPSGGLHRRLAKIAKSNSIDTSHWVGHRWNVNGQQYTPISEWLVENSKVSSDRLRKRLIECGLKKEMCECCENTVWNDLPIPLELHHVNGIHNDNRWENIQILCSNCHAQTPNYGVRNRLRIPPKHCKCGTLIHKRSTRCRPCNVKRRCGLSGTAD